MGKARRGYMGPAIKIICNEKPTMEHCRRAPMIDQPLVIDPWPATPLYCNHRLTTIHSAPG